MPVFVRNVPEYECEKIKSIIRESLEALNVSLGSKKTVVLKPNLVLAAMPRSGIITHPVVTAATAEVLMEKGISDISIIEGPGLGHVASMVFRDTTYSELARKLNIKIYDIETIEMVTLKWKYGKIRIPAMVLDADLYINLPKLKTHGLTTVSLSIKNQKGLVPPLYKKLIHKLGLHDPLIELLQVISPHLVILDGIEGMEGEGPVKGRKVLSKFLMIGTNALEVDVAASKLMGINYDEVKHLAIGVEKGLGSGNPVIIGDEVSKMVKSYRRADPEWGRILKVCSRRNPYACSMCVDVLAKAVARSVKNPKYWAKFVAKFGYYALFKGINIIQGLNTSYIPSKGWTVCFGKCARDIAKKHGFAYIPGCPPEPEDIFNYFFLKLSKNKTNATVQKYDS